MMENEFDTFFSYAMGNSLTPYPYQRALSRAEWPGIVSIPTGVGKTAALIISWLYKRSRSDGRTPRRLVYCLPMRVLVEQTYGLACTWIERLVRHGVIACDRKPTVRLLMGGEIDADWDRYPERDALLIGTQDQLLSRALNRGYGSSRFRWPVQFGLLNSDCLWVMDEVQLMGSGLATTTQLHAFREMFGVVLPVRSLWMSATLHKDWLFTVNFKDFAQGLQSIDLSDEDKAEPSVSMRINAKKPLESIAGPDKMDRLARLVVDRHRSGTLTLVVANTVSRATELYHAIKQTKTNAALSLIHSRFRPGDRRNALDRMLLKPEAEGSICVSTQVVEAGVDVSATTLITDLAPYASLVQRFGRCNRYGTDDSASIMVLEPDLGKKGAALPYTEPELSLSLTQLDGLTNAAPSNLPVVSAGTSWTHVIRAKDIIDLFDTSPNLAGLDIDVSRFIRDTEDHDVQVFWRDMSSDSPPEEEPAPTAEELCSVPVGDVRPRAREFWHWDHLEKAWVRPAVIAPGMVLLLPQATGGYSSETGWTGRKTDIPNIIVHAAMTEEADGDDPWTIGRWESLIDHTNSTVKVLGELLSEVLPVQNGWEDSLIRAARWHDAGKAHPIFQSSLHADSGGTPSVVWAKAACQQVTYERRGFRHELASALAALQNGLPDLVAYLVASHHGKVRMSIRSLPHERKPADRNIRFARGVWDGDTLPATDLGGGNNLPETILDLSFMELGEGERGPSWLERTLTLRDDRLLGIFRLGYLEALLRTADWRASAGEAARV